MNELSFRAMLTEVSDYLEKKTEVPENTFRLWCKEVEEINDEAIPFIIDKFKQNYERFPKGFPKKCNEYYREWLGTLPKEKRLPEGFDCRDPYCQDGWIFAVSIDPDPEQRMKYGNSYAFRCLCGKAEASKAIPIVTSEWLINTGEWEPTPPVIPGEAHPRFKTEPNVDDLRGAQTLGGIRPFETIGDEEDKPNLLEIEKDLEERDFPEFPYVTDLSHCEIRQTNFQVIDGGRNHEFDEDED